MLPELGRRLLMLLRRKRFDANLDEEMRLHRELREQEQIERGLSPKEAQYAARRRFGNDLLIREESRDMWGWNWLEHFVQDVRYGLRQLRLSPGFTAVAILSLALGIGANTAIFQLIDAVRLRSLPVSNPRELAEIRIVGGNGGMGINPSSYPQLTRPIWEEIRLHHEPFSQVFSWSAYGVHVGQGSETQWRNALSVSGEFFNALGIRPYRGRLFSPADEGACPATKAVVSYSYWQSEMGGHEAAVGSALRVDDALLEVVGVSPPEFFGLAVGEDFDVAFPRCRPKGELDRNDFNTTVMGRLRPGWSIERASAQLAALSPRIFEATAPPGRSAESTARYKKFKLAAYPAWGGVSLLRSEYDSSLWLLLGITGLVLLIACANLANLLLARASAREREIAVRLALGASRGRLLGQILAESGLLAMTGATLGILLARWLSGILVWSISTESHPVSLPMYTDWRVLLFAVSVACLACVIFGIVPAWRATRAEPMAAMKSGGRGTTGSRERLSTQRAMVVTQVAVSLLLLVGALLFVRSFHNLITFDPGMREAGITVAILDFHLAHTASDRYLEYQHQLLDEARSIPGVTDAATTTNLPLLGGSWAHDVHVGAAKGWSKFTWVSPGYFQTMGIPLIVGRDFSETDTAASQRVAVVNRAFVRLYLGEANPIGRIVQTVEEPNYPSTAYQIVGVIPDTKYSDLRGETPPMTFAPASQFPAPGPWTLMMIHSNLPPAILMSTFKRTIGEKHPEVITASGNFQAWIRNGLVRERLMAMLSGFFGFLAALLAMLGLYGMVSYAVARRQNEIGVRIALGAQPGQVVTMVMLDAGRMLGVGVAAGTVLALIAGRGASALLFGLKPYDPLTLLAAGTLLGAIAALASFLPARRATKVDPMVALRYE